MTSDASNKPSCTPPMFERDLGWRLDLCTDPVPVLAGFLRGFHHTSGLLVEWRAVKWETVLKMMYQWASSLSGSVARNNNNIRWRFDRHPQFQRFRHEF